MFKINGFTMVKRLSFVMILMFSFVMAVCAKDNDAGLNYDIEGAGTATQGSYMVKVTVITKDKKISDDVIARCAVHGVLFKGFSNKELRQNQRPLAGSAMVEAQHADFFKDFFKEDGIAKNYVSIVNGSRQVTKSGKKYRVSSVVTVNKEQLHSDLEKAGIIKGLNTGF